MPDEQDNHDGDSTEEGPPPVGDVTQPDSTGSSMERLSSRLRESQELPEQIGHFKILEVLGEGGMGIVYLAEQSKPIRRRVALKLVKLGMDTKQVVARFEAERQALALMNHPNIAKVFDAGATEAGRPYFIMEYVPGLPITEYSDKQRLNINERLELFRDVCLAVQHAHQKGIIHRDIKPGNILVSVQDGAASPKIIDFGVAKATNQHLTEKTLFTEHGQLIGTPEYMSPEQAEMDALDIDTRTDIYSLGVVLYELLSGALPFEPKSLRRAGLAEIHRIIREEDPPMPSTRLSSLGDESGAIAQRHRSDVHALLRALRGDLDCITMMAMEKDRTRRYGTAAELAEEIRRHLNHEPVDAAKRRLRYKHYYTARKFVRRNRVRIVLTAALIAVVFTGSAFGWYKKRRDAELRLQQRRAKAALLTSRGALKQGEGDLPEAQRLYTEALIFVPHHFAALANLAALKKDEYFRSEPRTAPPSLLEESKVLCERALAQQPEDGRIWNIHCVTSFALGEPATAEKSCRNAIRFDPEAYPGYSSLAAALALQHRMDEALEAATRAVQTAERLNKADSLWVAASWQTLATIQLHLKQPAAARSLERAFTCDHDDEWGYTLRALMHLTLPGHQDPEKALEDATVANSLVQVGDARLKRVVALAHLRNDHYDKAVQFAEEAMGLGGLKAANHLILALAESGRHNLTAARDHLVAARATWPEELTDDAGELGTRNAVMVNVDREALWIESAEALQELRAEAESLIAQRP